MFEMWYMGYLSDVLAELLLRVCGVCFRFADKIVACGKGRAQGGN